MGRLWRNREFRRYFLLSAGIGAAASVGIFYLHRAAGLLVFALVLVLLAVFSRFTARRYAAIARLAEELAGMAAGDNRIHTEQYQEGEVDILASELAKITSSLLHQTAYLQADKSFLSDSLADISHQLKTPLTSIAMLTDLLDTPDLPPDKQREFLQGIRSSQQRIHWLITSLLKLSQLDAGAVVFRMQPIRLDDVVAQALEPLRIPMELKNQTLVLEMVPDMVCTGDRYWLSEALGNLLKNCVGHTPEGGTITVAGEQNALYTQLQITDNGPGIPPDDLPHIFERFYRGKNAAPDSVGIGLALSKSIVENLGGTLQVENRSQGGSSFLLKLYTARQ